MDRVIMTELALIQMGGNGMKGSIIIKVLGIVNYRIIIMVLISITVPGELRMETLITEIKGIIHQIGNLTGGNIIITEDGIVGCHTITEGLIFTMDLGILLTGIRITEITVPILLVGNGIKENTTTKEDGTADSQVISMVLIFIMDRGIPRMVIPITETDIHQGGSLTKVSITTIMLGIVGFLVILMEGIFIMALGTLHTGIQVREDQDFMMEVVATIKAP